MILIMAGGIRGRSTSGRLCPLRLAGRPAEECHQACGVIASETPLPIQKQLVDQAGAVSILQVEGWLGDQPRQRSFPSKRAASGQSPEHDSSPASLVPDTACDLGKRVALNISIG